MYLLMCAKYKHVFTNALNINMYLLIRAKYKHVFTNTRQI